LKARLTDRANYDSRSILRETNRLFGQGQVWKYASIIQRGIELLCGDPLRPTSKAHDEFGVGIRSFHLRLASGRTAGASHILYYVLDNKQDELVNLRILADSMLPSRRVIATANDRN
jgi:plasmid stabilization system protein ParE